jgi:hypothetical protein
LAQVAGFISESRPVSNRNGGRHQIGIPGRIESEFAKTILEPCPNCVFVLSAQAGYFLHRIAVMNFDQPIIGVALSHWVRSRLCRSRFLRLADARLHPSVQVRRRIDRGPARLSEDRSTAHDGKLCEPSRRAWQAPGFADMSSRISAAKVF